MFNYNNFRINEIDFNIVETEFTILRSDNIERYDFISKKGNSYSVYFKMTDEDDEELSNGNQLSAYTDLDTAKGKLEKAERNISNLLKQQVSPEIASALIQGIRLCSPQC